MILPSESLLARGYVPGPIITGLPTSDGAPALFLMTPDRRGVEEHIESNNVITVMATFNDEFNILNRQIMNSLAVNEGDFEKRSQQPSNNGITRFRPDIYPFLIL